MFFALFSLFAAASEQDVLDVVAQQITADSGKACTAPNLASCGSSCSGSGCTFNIDVAGGLVTYLYIRYNSLTKVPTEISILAMVTYLNASCARNCMFKASGISTTIGSHRSPRMPRISHVSSSFAP